MEFARRSFQQRRSWKSTMITKRVVLGTVLMGLTGALTENGALTPVAASRFPVPRWKNEWEFRRPPACSPRRSMWAFLWALQIVRE
jgi:hypothetical protein